MNWVREITALLRLEMFNLKMLMSSCISLVFCTNKSCLFDFHNMTFLILLPCLYRLFLSPFQCLYVNMVWLYFCPARRLVLFCTSSKRLYALPWIVLTLIFLTFKSEIEALRCDNSCERAECLILVMMHNVQYEIFDYQSKSGWLLMTRINRVFLSFPFFW